MSETSSWCGEIPWVDFHVKIHRNKKMMASPCFAACRGAANSQSFDMFKNPGIFHGAWRIAGERVSHQFDDEYLHWWDWDGIFDSIQHRATNERPKNKSLLDLQDLQLRHHMTIRNQERIPWHRDILSFFIVLRRSYIIDQSDGTWQIWEKFGFGQVGQVIQGFDPHFLRIRSWNYRVLTVCYAGWNMFPEMNLRYVCNKCFMIHSLKPSNPSRNLISGPSQLPRKHSFGPRPNGYWMRAKVVARDLCLGAEQDFLLTKREENNPV